MPKASPARRQLSARIATATRHYPSTDVTRLRQDLAALQIEEHIQEHLASPPGLRPEQREALATLLRGSSAAREVA